MKEPRPSIELAPLEPLVGEWSVEAIAPWAPPSGLRGTTVFEWMTGGKFLVQRWEVPIDEAPDGLAVIGSDPENSGGYLQHYFDSRGVARVYSMGFDEGVWTLSRTKADFSALDFSQRFTGTFGDDGRTIQGRWEICHDVSTWEHDFGLVYRRAE
jgi:hypothetical protein